MSWPSHAQATGTAAAAANTVKEVIKAVAESSNEERAMAKRVKEATAKRVEEATAKRGNVPVRTNVPVRRRTSSVEDGAKEAQEERGATEDAVVVVDQDAGKGKDREDQVKVPLMTSR